MRAMHALAALAALAGACRDDDGDGGPDPRQTVVELPATPNRDLDLLFVIDDSTGLLEVQTQLKLDIGKLLDRLKAVPGGLPSLHVGVVTTDMGTQASGSPTPAPAIGQLGQGGCSGVGRGGALQTFAAGADLTGSFLSDVELPGGGRTRNYVGELQTVLGKMITAGAGGCGFEQPLAAMRAALDGNAASAGFLRGDALLGVILVTDEDDCSAASPRLFDPNDSALGPLQSFRCTQHGVVCAEGGATALEMGQVGAKGGCAANEADPIIDGVAAYRDFLLRQKPDPRRVIFGGIVGPAAPVAVELRAASGGGAQQPALAHACAFTGQLGVQVADPAPRLAAFAAGLGDRAELTTICRAEYAENTARIGDLLRRAMGSACVEAALADADPAAPGAQLDCVVEDVTAGGARAEPVLPCAAAAGTLPCWRLEEDPAGCPFSPAPNLALRIERAATPDPSTITRMRCAAAP